MIHCGLDKKSVPLVDPLLIKNSKESAAVCSK